MADGHDEQGGDDVEKAYGQVPRLTIPPTLTAMPTEPSALQRIESGAPVLQPSAVVKGLPLDDHQARALMKAVDDAARSSANEAVFRTTLYRALMHDARVADPAARQEVMRRATAYYKTKGVRRNGMSKSEPVEKAEARGGSYYRRVTAPTGQHRYFYSQEDYEKQEGAHLSGEDVKRSRAKKAVLDHVGESGCSVEDLRALSGKHDDEHIADGVRELVSAGDLEHKGGKLKRKLAKAAPPIMVSKEMEKQKAKDAAEQREAAGIETPAQRAADAIEEADKSERFIIDLEKAAGSRGGKVVGYTSSGKPKYAKKNAPTGALTGEHTDKLPVGSVVMGGDEQEYTKHHDGWESDGGGYYSHDEMSELVDDHYALGTPATLKKSEGARGGHVIGHTSSGKPIYESKYGYKAAGHKVGGVPYGGEDDVSISSPGWDAKDHGEAAAAHRQQSKDKGSFGPGTGSVERAHDALAAAHERRAKELGSIKKGEGAMKDTMCKAQGCGGMYKAGVCSKCGGKMLMKGQEEGGAPAPETDDITEDGANGDGEGDSVNASGKTSKDGESGVIVKSELEGWLSKADGSDEEDEPGDEEMEEEAEGDFEKSYADLVRPMPNILSKAMGPFIGPHGGKWADPDHKVPYNEKKHAGKAPPKAKEHDEHLAEDLHLTTANDSRFHGQHEAIRKNLVNKMAAGTYDHAQATKLFGYLTKRSGDQYHKDMGVKPDAATRNAAAKKMADQFADEAKHGEHDRLLNKKNAKKVAAHKATTGNDNASAYHAGGIDKKSESLATEKHGPAAGPAAQSARIAAQAASAKANTAGASIDDHMAAAKAHHAAAAAFDKVRGTSAAESASMTAVADQHRGEAMSHEGYAENMKKDAVTAAGKAFSAANEASGKAQSSGKPEDHAAAASLHKDAMEKQKAAGAPSMVDWHANAVKMHTDASKKASAMDHTAHLDAAIKQHDVVRRASMKRPLAGAPSEVYAKREQVQRKFADAHKENHNAPIGKTTTGKTIANGTDYSSYSPDEKKQALERHQEAYSALSGANPFRTNTAKGPNPYEAATQAHLNTINQLQGRGVKKSEDSMTTNTDLSLWLEKARGTIPGASDTSEGENPPNDLPSGVPDSLEDAARGDQAGGDLTSGAGKNDGGPGSGKVAGVPETSGGSKSDAKEERLNGPLGVGDIGEGDKVEMPTESIDQSGASNIGSGKTMSKADDARTFYRAQPDVIEADAEAQRALAIRKAQSEEVLTNVGIGKRPPAREQPQRPQATYVAKGAVLYSDASDLVASELAKADQADVANIGMPGGGVGVSPLMKSNVCPACRAPMPGFLTACPSCGAGSSGLAKAQGASGMEQPHTWRRGGLRAPEEKALYLPNGTKKS